MTYPTAATGSQTISRLSDRQQTSESPPSQPSNLGSYNLIIRSLYDYKYLLRPEKCNFKKKKPSHPLFK